MFSTALVTAYATAYGTQANNGRSNPHIGETQPVTGTLPIPGPSFWAHNAPINQEFAALANADHMAPAHHHGPAEGYNFDLDQVMLAEYDTLPDEEFAHLLNSVVNEAEHCRTDVPHVNAPASPQVLLGAPRTIFPVDPPLAVSTNVAGPSRAPSAADQLLTLAESLPADTFGPVDLQHQLDVYFRNLADDATSATPVVATGSEATVTHRRPTTATPSPITPLSSVVATPFGGEGDKANMTTAGEKDYGPHRSTAPVVPSNALRLNGDRKALEFGEVGDPFFPRVQAPAPEDARHNRPNPPTQTWGFLNYSANVPEHAAALMSGVDVSGGSKQWKKDEARRLKAEHQEKARKARAKVKAKKAADKAAVAEQKRRESAAKRATTKAAKSLAKKKDKGKERAI
ncbi:hypothetical protein CspHIS471_0101650 [Cutaneotrichosporon sp. HIS471]|nr:hypothetical protein CspHIS471_0101650 [Cutaneotrichosporon sp. HIS471]